MDNEKRYKVLQSATSKISKVIQKAAQMESCKNTPENYEKFLLYKPKLPNIRQLRYPDGLSQKRKVNNFTQTKGGLTRIDLNDANCMIRLIRTCKLQNRNNFLS